MRIRPIEPYIQIWVCFETPKVGKGDGRKFSAPAEDEDVAAAAEDGVVEPEGFGRVGRPGLSVGRNGGLVLVGPGVTVVVPTWGAGMLVSWS